MNDHDVCTKTAKGLAERTRHTLALPRDCYSILGAVDGRTNVEGLRRKLPEISAETFKHALDLLVARDLVRLIPDHSKSSVFGPLHDAEVVVEELDSEDGMAAWEAAKRSAMALREQGYFNTPAHVPPPKTVPRILIVEDDPVIARIEVMLLQRAGFKTELVTTGGGLQPALAGGLPDLITLDVALPDITGFELLDWLKKHPQYSGVPAVMVTASGEPEDVARGLRGGADGYIIKPFRPDALVRCVLQVLNLDGG